MAEIIIKKSVVLIVSREGSRALLKMVQDACSDFDTLPLRFLAIELKKSLVYVEEQIVLGEIEP